MIPPVVHTVEVEIEISGDMIRLGQLLKFADLVTDGGQAKALIASGAGAQARISIGIVITFGMLVGTLFTLFVVPVIYSVVARRRSIETAHPA